MTIDDIKALIASDESRTLELKKTTGELKDGMHAACVFINTEGGWDGAFVYVTFKRPVKAYETAKANLGGNDTLSTPMYPLSTPQVELLTEKMGDSYMTMKEIAELCGIKDLKYFRESYITPALEAGVLERLYPNQPNHPKQKYKLHI